MVEKDTHIKILKVKRLNLKPWVARLHLLSKDHQNIVLTYLDGLDETQTLPTTKELRKLLKGYEKKHIGCDR